jgi:hypothetical protein
MKKLAVLVVFLVGCASIPPKPLCKYMELPVEIAPIPVGEETVYCLQEDSMNNLGQNYLDLMQCVTDYDVWAIQVEKAVGK